MFEKTLAIIKKAMGTIKYAAPTLIFTMLRIEKTSIERAKTYIEKKIELPESVANGNKLSSYNKIMLNIIETTIKQTFIVSEKNRPKCITKHKIQ